MSDHLVATSQCSRPVVGGGEAVALEVGPVHVRRAAAGSHNYKSLIFIGKISRSELSDPAGRNMFKSNILMNTTVGQQLLLAVVKLKTYQNF